MGDFKLSDIVEMSTLHGYDEWGNEIELDEVGEPVLDEYGALVIKPVTVYH